MGGIAVVAVGVFLLILPTVISELAGLLANLPTLSPSLGSVLDSTFRWEPLSRPFSKDKTTSRNSPRISPAMWSNYPVRFWAGWLLGNLSVVALLSFYLTAEAPKVRRTVLELLPRKQQFEVLRLWEIATDKIGGYLYSRALMGFISGLASYAVLRLLGVPFAAPLAILVGFVSQFVPVVGTYLAYALPTLIALGANGLRPR